MHISTNTFKDAVFNDNVQLIKTLTGVKIQRIFPTGSLMLLCFVHGMYFRYHYRALMIVETVLATG